MSRLGNPVARGAARFAQPVETDVKALKRQIEPQATPEVVEEEVTPPRRPPAAVKQPVTIRLTPAGIERLAELEIALRRSGIRARQASASEIVETLVRSISSDQLLQLLNPNGRQPE